MTLNKIVVYLRGIPLALVALAGLLVVAMPGGLVHPQQLLASAKALYKHGLPGQRAPGHPVAAAAPVVVPPTRLGINLAGADWWNDNPVFANLVRANSWSLVVPGKPWQDMPRQYLTHNGEVETLPEGAQAALGIVQPMTGPKGTLIRCTYEGAAHFSVLSGFETLAGNGVLTFRLVHTPEHRENVVLMFDHPERNRPIRNIDCREAGVDRAVRFDPQFLSLIKHFQLIRFMDLQRTNFNLSVTWAGRRHPEDISAILGEGMAVEDMVDLANTTQADPWFTIPWNASPDYVEGFAHYVHDHLRPGLTAYVELSNEVWNNGFLVAAQARQEGRALGLSGDDNMAQMFRHAQRTREVMTIWTRVFFADQKRVVRVLATQNANPWLTEQAVTFKDTAQFVDALATAPYFGNGYCGDAAERAVLVKCLEEDIDRSLGFARQTRDIAHKYHKRFITYEAGQHVLLPRNLPLLKDLNRDPAMEALYAGYIRRWQAEFGDYLVVYASAGPISQYGAWGLREYPGQPMSETPKLRAVLHSGLTRAD